MTYSPKFVPTECTLQNNLSYVMHPWWQEGTRMQDLRNLLEISMHFIEDGQNGHDSYLCDSHSHLLNWEFSTKTMKCLTICHVQRDSISISRCQTEIAGQRGWLWCNKRRFVKENMLHGISVANKFTKLNQKAFLGLRDLSLNCPWVAD